MSLNNASKQDIVLYERNDACSWAQPNGENTTYFIRLLKRCEGMFLAFEVTGSYYTPQLMLQRDQTELKRGIQWTEVLMRLNVVRLGRRAEKSAADGLRWREHLLKFLTDSIIYFSLLCKHL